MQLYDMWEGTVAAPAVLHIWGIAEWISAAFGTRSCTFLRTKSGIALSLVHFLSSCSARQLFMFQCVALSLTQCLSVGIVGTLIVQLAASLTSKPLSGHDSCCCAHGWSHVPHSSLCLELESNDICGFHVESVVSQCMHVSLHCVWNFYLLLFCHLLVPTSRCSIYLS